MTSEQKIQAVERQITACEQGRTNVINCPYCGEHNRDGDPLCCILLGRAVAGILMRKDLADKAEHAEQIAEKVSRN